MPDLVAPVMQWFGEISARRGNGGFGPNPITYADIEAWERRRGVRLRPHEEDWIFALDRLVLESASSKPKGADERKPRRKRKEGPA